MGSHTDFANAILKNEKKVEQKMFYTLMKYKNRGSYDVLKDMSGYIFLVQLMNYLVNVNNAISVVGY